MTRSLLRTAGTLALALTHLIGVAAAVPTAGGGDTTNAVDPPGGFPDQVPDFVTAIIEAIQVFLTDESGASPGGAVSGVAGENGG